MKTEDRWPLENEDPLEEKTRSLENKDPVENEEPPPEKRNSIR